MSDRNLIFNAKGAQIGYIEADQAFDLSGKDRCKFARATGNLFELNGEKIIGHISLDGTFVGLTWISEELFGKPSGEVHPGRAVRSKPRPRHRPKKVHLQRPEKSSVKEPNDLPPRTATVSQPENAVDHSQPFVGSAGDPKTVLNVSERAADEALGHHLGPTVGAPDQTKTSAEHELLDRAIGMIRSALEERAE
jgi:hypothetical protein